MVQALRYKPEGRGFDSRWCHWNFSLTYSFRPSYGPGVDSASNRNEYQEYFLGAKGGRCVGLTTLSPSCATVLKSRSLILLETSRPVQACNGTAFYLYFGLSKQKDSTVHNLRVHIQIHKPKLVIQVYASLTENDPCLVPFLIALFHNYFEHFPSFTAAHQNTLHIFCAPAVFNYFLPVTAIFFFRDKFQTNTVRNKIRRGEITQMDS